MLTIDGLIAVISLCLTAFGLGYAIGSNNAKNNRPQPRKLERLSTITNQQG
ncbi:MAG: hypothetical protein ACLRZ9_00900 [Eubacterium sp.]